MSSPDPDPAAEHTGRPGAVASSVSRAVAEDLESIFPAATAAQASGARRLKLVAAHNPRGGKGRWRERRAASLGALMAAACVGVSAGALFARAGAPARPTPPPISPGVPITVAQAVLPPPGPLAPPALAPVAPAEPSAMSTGIAAFAAQPTRPVERAASTVRKSVAHRRQVRVAASCGRAARCGAGSLTTADARLRRAYAAAQRAGVSRSVLVAYRSEWGRLRHRAPRQPVLVAARYRAMAGDLDRLAAHQRVAQSEAPRTGPWRRIRMQLASLWR